VELLESLEGVDSNPRVERNTNPRVERNTNPRVVRNLRVERNPNPRVARNLRVERILGDEWSVHYPQNLKYHVGYLL
jgi:hypothetical protein